MYQNYLSASKQDYLKIINRLQNNNQTVRVKEIAVEKKVSMPSVTESIKKLAAEGWIFHKSRGTIELTAKGQEAADFFSKRSDFIRNFLTDVLGTKAEKADSESCILEHHLSEHSLRRLGLLYQFLNHCPIIGLNLLEKFRDCVEDCNLDKDCYCISEKYPHFHEHTTHTLLNSLEPGEKAKILLLSSNPDLRDHFFSNSLLPGIEIEMQSKNKDEIIIKYKSQSISIPTKFGSYVEVSKIIQKDSK